MAKSPYANVPEPLKSHLPALFNSYPDLDKPSPSSWFSWRGSGEVLAHYAGICHAHMCYDGPGWEEMVTAVPNSSDLGLEYLRMLIRGPFCAFADLIKLDRVADKYYLHLLSLNKWPANVLMNFCIASRTPIEFKFLLKPWAKRCESGIEPVLAFLLTYSYGCMTNYDDDTPNQQYVTRTFNMARPGHMWLDPASSWYHVLHGEMSNVSKPFSTHPQDSRPCNIIWGKSEDYVQLMSMTDEQICEFYTQPIQVLEPIPEPIKIVKAKKKPYPYFINPAAEVQPLPWPQANVWQVQVNAQPFADDQPQPEMAHEPEELDDDF